MNRSTRRELAFKLLYSIEVQKNSDKEQIDMFFQENNIKDDKAQEYIIEVINGINDNIEDIMNLILKNLKKDWSLERVSKIDLAILKLAIYEIQYKKIEFKIVINEAVELAKKYGEESSPNFINGLLASVVK